MPIPRVGPWRRGAPSGASDDGARRGGWTVREGEFGPADLRLAQSDLATAEATLAQREGERETAEAGGRARHGRQLATTNRDLVHIESVADGDLVSKVRYPGEGLDANEAVSRYRAELLEKYDSDFIPYTFQSGDSARASEVNDNFQSIQDHSNELSASRHAVRACHDVIAAAAINAWTAWLPTSPSGRIRPSASALHWPSAIDSCSSWRMRRGAAALAANADDQHVGGR